ncbi:hypothetical protein phiNJ2_0035 [Streptococcus phage phiNJ2]|nr:hypothetical protein phiNJ2_0035 [Streptococcus phage phiNJ2]AFU88695.1 hypothetical protein phiNJ2_0035 [Streptococcus phage phiNJ2]
MGCVLLIFAFWILSKNAELGVAALYILCVAAWIKDGTDER